MGTFQINGTLSIKDNLRLWSDAEGANIRLITASDSNKVYELDTNSGNLRLYYCTDGGHGSSGYKSWLFSPDGSLTATKFVGSLQGNADTATKLLTARTINGISFDGSANITFHSLYPQQIANNTDLNSITQSGMYYSPQNAITQTLSNSPTSNAFFLIVGKHAGYYQRLTEYLPNNPKTWIRNYYGGAWGDWIQEYNEKETDSRYVNITGDTMTGSLQIGNSGQTSYVECKMFRGAKNNRIYFCANNGNGGHIIAANDDSSSQIDFQLTQTVFSKPVQTSDLVLLKNGVTSSISSNNSGFLHFNTSATTGYYFNKNIYVQGDIYGGSGYNEYFIRSTNGGAYNCNTQYNTGVTLVHKGTNYPSGSAYGMLFTMAYRKPTGNTTPDFGGQIFIPCGDDRSYPNSMFFRTSNASSWNSWQRLWKVGDSITGAVWNDYAEYRESNCSEPGYVLIENGDDTLSKSTERLQQFAGISSDTWGFSQGQTEKAKTPIAVAGRVLAYTYQDRNNYKPGDAVCTAPNGTIDIMTEEEIIKYPHRIVGTVSCVPNYEEWGGGEGADRDPVKVNNRIWIKIK